MGVNFCIAPILGHPVWCIFLLIQCEEPKLLHGLKWLYLDLQSSIFFENLGQRATIMLVTHIKRAYRSGFWLLGYRQMRQVSQDFLVHKKLFWVKPIEPTGLSFWFCFEVSTAAIHSTYIEATLSLSKQARLERSAKCQIKLSSWNNKQTAVTQLKIALSFSQERMTAYWHEKVWTSLLTSITTRSDTYIKVFIRFSETSQHLSV